MTGYVQNVFPRKAATKTIQVTIEEMVEMMSISIILSTGHRTPELILKACTRESLVGMCLLENNPKNFQRCNKLGKCSRVEGDQNVNIDEQRQHLPFHTTAAHFVTINRTHHVTLPNASAVVDITAVSSQEEFLLC